MKKNYGVLPNQCLYQRKICRINIYLFIFRNQKKESQQKKGEEIVGTNQREIEKQQRQLIKPKLSSFKDQENQAHFFPIPPRILRLSEQLRVSRVGEHSNQYSELIKGILLNILQFILLIALWNPSGRSPTNCLRSLSCAFSQLAYGHPMLHMPKSPLPETLSRSLCNGQ